MSKISIDEIKEALARDGWKLISESYKNLDVVMEYECNEGHRVFAPWKKIRQKRVCPICEKNELKTSDIKIVQKKSGKYRTLGLDQATHITGWSIFDDKELIAYGTFTASNKDEIARDCEVKRWLIQMIQSWKPDLIGIEGIQLQDLSGGRAMGVTVYEKLARLQGILMECCYENKIQYIVCHTATWRAHCGVKGKSRVDRKRSMQNLVKKWYDVTVTDDESDAVGIGKFVAETAINGSIVENWE